MHRQFARAKKKKELDAKGDYKLLPQNDGEDDDDDGEDQPEEEQGSCSRLRKRLPDTEGDRFAMVVGVVIMLNAVVLGLETDLGQEHFIICEHMFGVFFTTEMCMRISQLGLRGYLDNKSNWFDALLVCTGDFDLWVSPFLKSANPSAKGSGNSSAKFMKLLRMFRVMRIVRLFKMFHELQIIMEAFIKALHTVMWVGLLTVILNYICAVFLTQTIGHNAEMWEEHEQDIKQWFGSIGNSMRTLFIIITLAEWDQIALVVSKHVNGFAVFVLAIAYITLTAFTMVSLITGIISEELVGAQRDDEVHKLEQIEKGKAELASNVKALLENFDDDKSGALSEDEVKRALSNSELKLMERLQALDITMEMDDFLHLIKRLRDACGTDEIPIDNIAQALKHLSGTASSSSIWDLKMLLLQLQNDNSASNSDMTQIGETLSSLTADFQTSTSEMSDKVSRLITNIDKIEARFRGENSEICSRLDQLMNRLDRLEATVQGEKGRCDQELLERLSKLEEIMHVFCGHLLTGGLAAVCAGNGPGAGAIADASVIDDVSQNLESNALPAVKA